MGTCYPVMKATELGQIEAHTNQIYNRLLLFIFSKRRITSSVKVIDSQTNMLKNFSPDSKFQLEILLQDKEGEEKKYEVSFTKKNFDKFYDSLSKNGVLSPAYPFSFALNPFSDREDQILLLDCFFHKLTLSADDPFLTGSFFYFLIENNREIAELGYPAPQLQLMSSSLGWKKRLKLAFNAPEEIHQLKKLKTELKQAEKILSEIKERTTQNLNELKKLKHNSLMLIDLLDKNSAHSAELKLQAKEVIEIDPAALEARQEILKYFFIILKVIFI